MDYKDKFYPESKFGGFTDIDGTIAFYSRINALIQPDFTLLDVGCGRGRYVDDSVTYRQNLRIFKGKVKQVIGLDVDTAAATNPYIDKFSLIENDNWSSIEDNSIDLCICDTVLEHLENPDKFFSEAARVLKNDKGNDDGGSGSRGVGGDSGGGYLCVRTPNFWSYVALSSMLIPNKYHAKVTEKVQTGRKSEDVFPTLYRCNSIRKIRKMLVKYNFTEYVVYGYGAEPSYLSFSGIAYWLGICYQKFIPRCFMPSLFVFARLGGR